MQNKKLLLFVGFILGILATVLFTNFSKNNNIGNSITYLQKLEINDYSPDLITVEGSYLESDKTIQMVTFECYLKAGTCIEANTFIGKEGIVGMIPLKEYEIIEKTPTRIVAKYIGTAAFHMFTIDLATKKVTFKNEANNNPNDVAVYELEDGAITLSKLKD